MINGKLKSVKASHKCFLCKLQQGLRGDLTINMDETGACICFHLPTVRLWMGTLRGSASSKGSSCNKSGPAEWQNHSQYTQATSLCHEKHNYQTNKSAEARSPSLSVVFLDFPPVWHRQHQKNLQILTELYKLNRPHLSQTSSTQMHIERLLSLILPTADLAPIQELSKHTC